MKFTKFTFAVAAILVAALAVSCASSGGGNGGGAAKSAGPAGVWAFDDPAEETAGWELTPSEFYQYRGDIALSYDDATFGNGMLRLDVDFTNDINTEWSEPKLKIDLPKSINMKGVTQFAFDFYYNPSYRTTGSFKAKVFSNNGASVDSAADIVEDGEDAGDGFVKTNAVILIMPTAGFLPDMRFSIAGSLTDYKGPVFLDNLRWE
ncbi:MAG: hypothetical protein LBH85_08685 [Treponema sp.]|jgi:mannan endo-1,4-beta-mannosidase|nr:hypothetical protein [Treponema sp.]